MGFFTRKKGTYLIAWKNGKPRIITARLYRLIGNAYPEGVIPFDEEPTKHGDFWMVYTARAFETDKEAREHLKILNCPCSWEHWYWFLERSENLGDCTCGHCAEQKKARSNR